MNFTDIKNHPLVLRLATIDLLKEELSWELHDLADALADFIEVEEAKGHKVAYLLKDFLKIAAPKFTSCNESWNKGMRSKVVQNNHEILLVTVMVLKMNSMRYPNRKVA